MSQSSTARFFYGYAWEEEGSGFYAVEDKEWGGYRIPEEYGDDVDGEPDYGPANDDLITNDLLLAEFGIAHRPWGGWVWPDLPYDERIAAREQYQVDHQAEFDAYAAAEAAIKARRGTDVVEYAYHGALEFSLPYVFVKETHVSVEWSEAKQVDSLEIGADWDEKLARWLATFKIDPAASGAIGPGWLLVAEYG